MSKYAEEIREFLYHSATGQGAPEGYTGSNRVHLGVRAPMMQAFVKDWISQHKTLSYDDFLGMLDALYHGESLEERCITGYFMARYHVHRRNLDFDTLDKWLAQLEGWAEVDSSCQSSFMAKDLLARWQEWEVFLLKLAQDSNINKRRASLVLLRKALSESDDERFISLALRQIETLKHEKDKLITKAVSWILREGIKYHKVRIEDYLEKNADSLPAIAVRETRKKLETGKK